MREEAEGVAVGLSAGTSLGEHRFHLGPHLREVIGGEPVLYLAQNVQKERLVCINRTLPILRFDVSTPIP